MLSSTILSLLAVAGSALATTQTVSYDTGYDDASRSMAVVSCSDGVNGLTTRYGWETQGQIPQFPYIGGSSDIAGWNSASCGQCYSVTYNSKTIYMLAIDHAASGLNMGEKATNDLTGGNAVQFGRIDATVTKVDYTKCGLPHSKRGLEFEA